MKTEAVLLHILKRILYTSSKNELVSCILSVLEPYHDKKKIRINETRQQNNDIKSGEIVPVLR